MILDLAIQDDCISLQLVFVVVFPVQWLAFEFFFTQVQTLFGFYKLLQNKLFFFFFFGHSLGQNIQFPIYFSKQIFWKWRKAFKFYISVYHVFQSIKDLEIYIQNFLSVFHAWFLKALLLYFSRCFSFLVKLYVSSVTCRL